MIFMKKQKKMSYNNLIKYLKENINELEKY